MVMDREGKLADKIALVTGAGGGIGRASAILFAQEGAKVVVCDIKGEIGKETVDMIKAEGGEAIFVKADISSVVEVKELMQSCVDNYGTLDVLYNCAGVFLFEKDGPVDEVSEKVWDSTIAINLTGTFLCCKYAVPIMLENKRGSIVNMASIAALIGTDFHAYVASKGGVLSLTRSIAMSYAPNNIRANSICPGLIETPMTEPLRSDQESTDFYLSKTPLGRTGQPIEVARLALYLASDESSYVTGATFSIDGGFVAV